MTTQADKALLLRSLHVPADPLVLYNIWDAGSAKVVARAGAKAIATGSWSVAAAQGYADGEAIPLDEALAVVGRITASTELPVTVDFEGGYAAEPDGLGRNVQRLLQLGVVGLNLEDQLPGGVGRYPIPAQMARIAAVRAAADAAGIPAFVNARTDVFLQATDQSDVGEMLEETLRRGLAFAKAGADGFFVPGVKDHALIARICAASPLPVNVMTADEPGQRQALAALGVARISLGPAPYRGLAATLEERARAHY